MPETPLRSAESTSAAILGCPVCWRRSVVNRSVSRPSLAGVADQVFGRQCVLVVEQLVVHRPELALAGGGLGGLGGELRVRVHVGERQVPPHVAQVTVAGQQLADHRLGPAAVGAFEVAVLHQRDRCPVRAAHMIAFGIDRHR